MIEIRPAIPSDIKHLYGMIMECADEMHARSEVSTTAERLLEDGFGTHPSFQALIAWDVGAPVGFALWFPMYSSWKGKKTLYLEDLFIRSFWRRRGIAKLFLMEIEKIALSANSNLAWECDRDRLDLRHIFLSMGAIDRSSKISFYMEDSEMRAHLQDNGVTL